MGREFRRLRRRKKVVEEIAAWPELASDDQLVPRLRLSALAKCID